MRKKISLLLMALVLSAGIGVNAQQAVVYLSEDFQASSSTLPTGWDAQDYQCSAVWGAESYMWKVNTGGYNASGASTSTDYCAYLYVYKSYSTYAALKSPTVTLPANRACMLSFRAKCSQALSNLAIYVSTDGGATYQNSPLVPQVALTTSYEEYAFSLAAYQGQSVRIVFRGEPNSSSTAASTYYWVDDIKVETTPQCQQAVDPYITGLTTATATVNWGLKGTGFGDVPDSFNISLLQAGNLVDSVHRAMPVTSLYSYTFTGLTPATAYTIRVESNCQAEYRGLAQATEISFVTPETARPLPYNENFDALTDVPASFYTKGVTFNTTAGSSYGGAGNSIRLQGSAAEMAYVIFPPIAERADNFEMDFRLKRTSNDKVYFMAGYVTDPADITTFAPVVMDSVVTKDVWENRRFNTAAAGDQTTPVYPAVLVQNMGTTSLYIDNVSVHNIPTCTRPEGFVCTAYDAYSATLGWGTTNAGNVRIMIYGDGDTTLLRALTVPATAPYTVTGLTPQTTYNFHLRGLCSATDSSDITDAVMVRTACASFTDYPLVQDFEGTEFPAECWSISTTGPNLPQLYTESASASTPHQHSGSRCVNFRDQQAGNSSQLTAPAMACNPAKLYSVSFWMYRGSSSAGKVGEQLDVYVTPNPDDLTQGTRLGYVSQNYNNAPREAASGLYEYYFEMPQGLSGTQYVVFKYNNQYGAGTYIDDIRIDEGSTCTGVRAHMTSIDESSCTMALDSVVTDVLMAYGPQGTPREQCTVFHTTDSVIALTGLVSGTAYDYYLSRICGNDTAEWTDVATFVTEAAPAAIPYACGFEDDAENQRWKISKSSPTGNNAFVAGTAADAVRSGNRAMYITKDGNTYEYNTSGTIRVYAARDIRFEAKQYMVSFDWKCTGGESTYDYGRAMLVPRGTDYSHVDGYDSGSIPQGGFFLGTGSGNYPDNRLSMTESGWVHVEQPVDMAQCAGDYTLLLFWRNDGSGGAQQPITFDNISVDELHCLAPAVATRNVTHCSATLVYSSQDSAQYEVVVDSAYFERDAIPATPLYRAVESGDSTALTGLTPNTVYYYIARSICAAGDTGSWSIGGTFRTACDTVAFPLFESFEGSVFPPDCWSIGTTGSNLPTAQTNTAAHSGDKAAYLRDQADGTYNWITTPQLNFAAGTSYNVSFWFRRFHYGSGDKINEGVYVYASSDPQDITGATLLGFVPREYAEAPAEAAAGVYNYRMPVPASVTGRKYIVFRYLNENGNGTHIDDISVSAVEGCPEISGTARNVTENSATVELTDTTIVHWQIAYGRDTVDTASLTLAEVNGASSFSIPDVHELTTYKYMVRNICGAGDTSAWSPMSRFTTPSMPTALPYYTSFEDDADNIGWTITQADNQFVIGTAAGAPLTGQRALYISSDRSSYNYNVGKTSNAYAYRLFRFRPSVHQIEFAWKCEGGESAYDYGRVMLVPANIDPTTITTNNVARGAIQLGGDSTNYGRMNLTEGWNYVSQAVDFTGRAGLYNLVIYWRNDISGGDPSPLSIDDINVYELTCAVPNVTITDISPAAATVNFAATGITDFEVMVDDQPLNTRDIPADLVLHTTSSTGSVQLTGLNPNTEYYYSVRAICGVGDTSAWRTPQVFTTHCAPVAVPYSETFAGTTSTNCWLSLDPAHPITRETTQHSTPGSMLVHATNVASPEFQVDSLDGYMLNGWAYATTDSVVFQAGVMSDPNDASTFEPLQDVLLPLHNQWYEFTVYFNALGSDDYNDPDLADIRYAKHVVLAAGNQNSIYFDDLELDALPTCAKPSETRLSAITSNSFQLSFTENGTATEWVVDVNGARYTVSSNPATVSGLAAQSDYTVRVASICGVGDTSAYTYAGTVRTACDVAPLPYRQSFESLTTVNADVSSNPDWINTLCWDQIGALADGSYPSYIGNGQYATDGVRSMKMICSRNVPLYMIMPPFGSTNGLTVSFDTKVESTTVSGELSVGYITNSADATTYVAVSNIGRTTDYTHAEVNVRGMPQGARIALRYDIGTQSNYYCWVDNILVEEILACAAPTTPEILAVDSASARVSFADTCATHTAWQYTVCSHGDMPESHTVVSITTDTFTVTGLVPATAYDVYVRTICGAGDTSAWKSTTFTTACTPFAVTASHTFHEDFEGAVFPPLCWSQTCYGTEEKLWNAGDDYAHSGNYSATVPDAKDGTRNVLITPALRFDSETGYTVRYWQYRTNSTYQAKTIEGFHIYLSDSPTIDASSQPLKTDLGFVAAHYLNTPAEATAGWYEYSFTIPASVRGVRYIMFAYSNQWGTGASIDDVTIEQNATCAASRTAPVINGTTMTTINATASLIDERAIQFGAVAGTAAAADPAAITGLAAAAADGSATITGLAAGTTYAVFYRYICEPGDTSGWSPAAECTTTETDCFEPQNLRLDGVLNANYVGIAWGGAPDAVAYEYRLVSGSNAVDTGIVTAPQYSNDSLAALTAYSFSVRTLCQSDTTAWSTLAFRTTEVAQSLPFVCNFDTAGQSNIWALNTYSGQNDFTIGTNARYNNTGALYISSDDSLHSYNNSTTSAASAYVSLMMDEGTHSISYDWISNGETSYDYGHAYLVPVSTVLGSNCAQSIPAEAINVGGHGEMANTADWTTTRTTFTITEAGVYRLVFTWRNDNSGGTQPPLAIDNVQVEKMVCPLPGEAALLYALDTTAAVRLDRALTDTRIEWGVTDQDSENTVSEWHTDTTGAATATYVLHGLTASTAYTFYARTRCDSTTVSPAVAVRFTTLANVVTAPFATGFEADNSAWQFAGTAGNHFVVGSGVNNGGSNALYITDDGSTHHYDDGSATYTYAYLNVDVAPGDYTVSYDWQADGEISNTTWYDYGRIVAVPASMAIPTNGTAISGLDDDGVPASCIPLDGNRALGGQASWESHRCRINVTERQVMRLLVFWHNDNSQGSQPPLAIDNINFTANVTGDDVYDTICYNQPYNRHGVNLRQGGMQPGDTTFVGVIAPADELGQSDTTLTVHLHMRPLYASEFNDTVCAGQPYNRGQFRIANPRTTIYSQTLTSSTGCDSTVTLNLYVVPTAETRYDTICAGDVYTLGTQSITAAGVYTEVTETSGGCPDTVTVYLTVADTLVSEAHTICAGQAYQFEGNSYTAAGTYRVSGVGAHGCPVTRELTLTVLETDITIDTTVCAGGQVFVADTVISTPGNYVRQVYNTSGCEVTYRINVTASAPREAHYSDIACEGRPYSGYGVNDAILTGDTLLTLSTRTYDQCDSLTYVSVVYHATSHTDTAATIRQGESITWHDNTYTEAGVYTETVQDQYGCDSVLTLTVTVLDAVEDVEDNGRIRVVPNPVTVGQAALVFTEATGRIARVEVINSYGAVIDSREPQSTPIDMQAPAAAGVYHVRVITADGRVYVEKLIVQ